MAKPLQVLMVEDSEDDTLLVIRQLKNGGWAPECERVETAEAMRAALQEKSWDIVVCDYQMPRFNGRAAIAVFKEAALDIPLIIVSGAIGEEMAVELMKAGAHDYVLKGSLSRLVPAVERELKEAKSRLQHREAENALRESEEKYRTLFAQSKDAILLTRPDGAILDANPAACAMFGRSVADICRVGRSDLADMTHPRLQEALTERLRRGSALAEFTMIRANGDKFPAEVTSAIFNNGSSQQKTIMVIRDRTERKRMEEQLNQSQKMESIGQLAGGIAHDFNNMLGVILGYVEMAMDKADPSQPLYAHLQEIRLAAERSANLTRQLLTFARKQVFFPRVMDLNEAIAGILKMLLRLIGENIKLETMLQPALWPVMTDPSQIDQILANLSLNARDAIAGCGNITIETGNLSIDEACCADHAGFTSGDYVLLAVGDDGCGMGKEILGKLFEPFFTTKEPGKGTGLGLATVFGIVKQNKGFIAVESEPGHGTTFRIYLPRHTAGSEETPAEKELQQPARRGHETLLVVEDEQALLSLCRMILEGQGYKVLAAGTPGEALQLVGEHPGEIDLLLTDVVMPEMNGKELAKKMLSLHPKMKCLFTSGYAAEVIVRQGVLEKGVQFLPKPFTIPELAAKVRETLDQR